MKSLLGPYTYEYNKAESTLLLQLQCKGKVEILVSCCIFHIQSLLLCSLTMFHGCQWWFILHISCYVPWMPVVIYFAHQPHEHGKILKRTQFNLPYSTRSHCQKFALLLKNHNHNNHGYYNHINTQSLHSGTCFLSVNLQILRWNGASVEWDGLTLCTHFPEKIYHATVAFVKHRWQGTF